MLKFQIASKEDMREAAKIENRRQYEDERKSRIFNARQRILGIDNRTLKDQINQKVEKHQADIEEEKRYLEEEQRRLKIINAKEKEFQQEQRRIVSEINFYRNRYQRKEDRKEFELYDPDFHKKSVPARLGDDDPNLGISSAQIFIGEDLASQQRLKAQKEQQRAWLEQQIRERKQAEEDRLKAEKLHQEAMEARDRRALELDTAQRNSRKEIKEAIAQYNKQLATEMGNRKKLAKQREEEDNIAEIHNNLTSDILNENPETAQSNFGPSKKIAYMYRGMTPEELEQFRREQKLQIEEKIKNQQSEVETNSQWDKYTNNLSRQILLKERDLEQRNKSYFEELCRENNQLAIEQKCKREILNKEMNSNEASDEYFAQFNTTTR